MSTISAEIDHWRLTNRVEDSTGFLVLADVDLLVVGAGPAGVAAATVGAEAGLRTLVVERYGFAGGAAVAGLSGTLCGLYAGSEDPARPPEQLVYGFAERFRKKLSIRGGVTGPQLYGHTYTVAHDPFVWREAADDLIEGSGAEILFHTEVISVISRKDELKGVLVNSKAGISAILAKRIIDASGDAAIVSRSGFHTTMGEQGEVQNPTMIFRMGNVDVERFLKFWGNDTISPPVVTQMIDDAVRGQTLDLPRNKIWIFPTTRPGQILVNGTRISGADNRSLNPIDPKDLTFAEIHGRRQARNYEKFIIEKIPGCEKSYMLDTGVEVGIRQTRSVVGMQLLKNDDVVRAKKSDSGIVRSAWPIELHKGSQPKLHWIVDDYYEIPFECLVPKVGENLIVAGRCLSAEHEAMASARVTAQCFEMGQAAALATILSLKRDSSYREISGAAIREMMTVEGSVL